MFRKILACIVLFAPLFGEMTIEEKVGQLLLVHCHENDADILIKDFMSVELFCTVGPMTSLPPQQVLSFTTKAQNLSKIPLFIAVDQEGGAIATIPCLTGFPGNKALGIVGNLLFAKESAYALGKELRSVGVNLNLAPVVDINDLPYNPIGVRSFGGTPDLVISFAKNAIEGFHEASLLTCLKHFPGLGNLRSFARRSACDSTIDRRIGEF